MSKAAATTFITNGTLGPFVVGDVSGFDTTEELIAFQLSGTWSGATVTLELCLVPGASPQTWSAMASGSFTTDAANVLRLPTGSQFRVVCSGSGSPVPAIYAAVRGQFAAGA